MTPHEFAHPKRPPWLVIVPSAAACFCLVLAAVFGLGVGLAFSSPWAGTAATSAALLYLITNGV